MANPWRKRLLDLTPGTPTYLNGVPVCRLPCAGTWFRVGVHVDYPCVTWQVLRLADAISRVASGHFPTLPKPKRPAPSPYAHVCCADHDPVTGLHVEPALSSPLYASSDGTTTGNTEHPTAEA